MREAVTIEEPTFSRWLFVSRQAALMWLVVRVWLGYQWIEGSLHKLTDPAWMSTGVAVQGFWERALAVPNGKPVIS